jgi:hypothetical protein
MGQAKNRKAEIAKLKILSAPRATNGFDMFWQADSSLINADGIIDLPGISFAVAKWAAHPEGLGFEGTPTVTVDKNEDNDYHNDGVKITLKWDKYVKVDIATALHRLRYVITGPEGKEFASYSGAEFYVSVEDSTEMIQSLKDLEAAE